jgi:hypothetical protein
MSKENVVELNIGPHCYSEAPEGKHICVLNGTPVEYLQSIKVELAAQNEEKGIDGWCVVSLVFHARVQGKIVTSEKVFGGKPDE